MYLEDASTVATTEFRFPQGTTRAWSDSFTLQPLGDPRIVGTVFTDADLYHAPLIERIGAQAYTIPLNVRGGGGKKIRDAETWNSPAARLLTLRALQLFCLTRNVNSAHVLDRWANSMQAGDYSTPHCHYDAEGAVVYALDPGESNPQEPMDGDLEIIDSRIPFCCPYQPERPIRGLTPRLRPGVMLTFPAEFLHHVRPYSGRRPRITLAWNISAGPPPVNQVIDPTRQVPHQYRAT